MRNLKLLQKADASKTIKSWMNSASPNTSASFVAAQEKPRLGKQFTDCDYIEESFVRISEHLYTDFGNKSDIIQKIKDL